MGFVISTLQQTAVVELSRHHRSGADRRSLADAQPSLMGELKSFQIEFLCRTCILSYHTHRHTG